MDRDSTITQFNFPNTEPSNQLPSESLLHPGATTSQPAGGSRHTPATQKVQGKFEKKRKRPLEDIGRHAAGSRFPKSQVLAEPESTNPTPAKKLPTKDRPNPFRGVPASTIPGIQPFVLPLTVKEQSPWKSYDRDYQTELGGPVTVAERKEPASGLVVVKEFSRANAESRLSMLRQVLDSYFVSCIEIFHFEDRLYMVSEHMTMSLLQIVAAPRYPRENHVAAIIGQILGGITFLESHNLVHGDMTCSNVLVNQEGVIKIANQECCRAASSEDRRDHPDVQALGDIVMQLMEKRKKRNEVIGASDLDRWSPTVVDFLSETMSASAKDLTQHPFLVNGWRKEDLLSLISFAQISSRRSYRIEH